MIVRPEDRALGRKLRRRRESARPKLSMESVAGFVRPKPQTRQNIAYVETGQVRASEEILRAYEDALSLKPETLTAQAKPPRPRGRKPLKKGGRRR